MNYKLMRKTRKAAKITQEDLANLLGVNRATISRYETGIIEPPVAQLTKIAIALGVRIEDLVGFETFDTPEGSKARLEEITSTPTGQTVTKIHKASGEIQLIDPQREHLIKTYDNLDTEDQPQLVKFGDLLAAQSKYQK